MDTRDHVDGPLTLHVHENGNVIEITWRGRSVAREPGQFILPILTKALDAAEHLGKKITIDFRQVEYLNSSTITPLIRILEQAKRGKAAVMVRYNSALNWQSLSFSALYLFQTADGRIKIQG